MNTNTYDDEYFKNRFNNDDKRLKSFKQEFHFMDKFFKRNGKICDVGCSTGEFLINYNWSGEKCGMEVNNNAILESKNNGIMFEKNILNQRNYFDVIVFRGTIQHLPSPFEYIEKAFLSLKKGGHIVFLATPNANSIYYKMFNDLPALDKDRNFYIPSDKTLITICQNYGFKLVDKSYPYLSSPYSSPLIDHAKFIYSLFFKRMDFPFWRSMMNLIFIK